MIKSSHTHILSFFFFFRQVQGYNQILKTEESILNLLTKELGDIIDMRLIRCAHKRLKPQQWP